MRLVHFLRKRAKNGLSETVSTEGSPQIWTEPLD